MRKILSCFLCLIMILSCSVNVLATETDVNIEIVYNSEDVNLDSLENVTDLSKDDIGYTAFKFLLDKDVISLLGPEEIGPDYEMSRVEFLSILRKYMTGNEGGVISETPYYYDVDIFAWYAVIVEWARNSYTAIGVGNDYFAPEDKITIEQMVTMLYNYISKNNISLNTVYIIDDPVNDMKDVSDWAYNAVTWANQLQILNKDEARNISPKKYATRRDMAMLLYNLDMLRIIEIN